MHGQGINHDWSAKPRTKSGTAKVEKAYLRPAPLECLGRDIKKGEGKKPEGIGDEANRPSCNVFIELYSSKGHSAHCLDLKHDAGGGHKTKPTPMRNGSVATP